MSENYVEKLIAVVSKEVGYLEKRSNDYLDDNTINAGSNNYTKYSRDLVKLIGSPYAQGTAWCDNFCDWCFIQAYGKNEAKKLLGGWSAYTPTSAQYYKNMGQWYTSNPQIGDQIFFKNSTRICHTGIVVGVDFSKVYTIEGNTSSAAGVVANGGCVAKKSYFLNDASIAGYGRPKYDRPSTTATYVATTNKIDMVDLSHHNTVTNWSKLAAECKNICIRMGYISYQSGALTTDKKFVENIKNATAQGIPVGVYVWDQSLNTTEAIALADYCIKAIKPYKISLPVFIDSEYYNSKREGRADNISKSQRTQNIIAFCERIKSAGYVPGVYASDSWFKSNLEFDKIKNYVIWCARYSTNKPTISKYDIWQYGSKNYSWATGAIDTNIIYNLKPNTDSNTENITPIFVLGKITANTLNVRSIPSTSGIVMKTYKKDNIVRLLEYIDTGWYKCGENEYISSKYVKYLKAEIVNCTYLNVRSSPSSTSSSNILTSVKVGTISTVTDHVNGWYQLLFDDGNIGWCSDKYIKLK